MTAPIVRRGRRSRLLVVFALATVAYFLVVARSARISPEVSDNESLPVAPLETSTRRLSPLPATVAADATMKSPTVAPTADPADSGDCHKGPWRPWSECSESCDGGEKTRSRTVRSMTGANPPPCNGVPTQQEQACNTHVCPKDCKLGDNWGEWKCSVSCGQGSRRRQREVIQSQGGAGASCPEGWREETACSMPACSG